MPFLVCLKVYTIRRARFRERERRREGGRYRDQGGRDGVLGSPFGNARDGRAEVEPEPDRPERCRTATRVRRLALPDHDHALLRAYAHALGISLS